MSFTSFDKPSFFADKISIPADCQIVFVADMFASDYQGGAELTTQALIDSSPLGVFKLHSKDVNLSLLEEGHGKFWIFGNYANLDNNLIPTIVANMAYSILEYDFKYCKYRSPEKHQSAEGSPCDCQDSTRGKMVSAFMHGARSLWWMSERQRDFYHNLFPFLQSKPNTVLSSVFDDLTLGRIKLLNAHFRDFKDAKRSGWVVLDSPSWVKGADEAKAWCKANDKEMISLWGLPYDQVLHKLAQAEGFVYLPSGMDTCPRMVIEAKLLGCELQLNNNVLHKDEIWFDTDDMLDTESYLYMTRSRFWNGIKADMEYSPTMSGYTTTRNCLIQKYPFRKSISSLLGFCDEVVVLDSGSTDGTWEELQDWALTDSRLKVYQSIKDYDHKRFAVFDGALKAEARSLCTSEFCWQQDSDEVVHENDFEKIRNILKQFPSNTNILALPVIEYWGSSDKVRMDVMPWKWRLSRNLPHVTHGIPKELQKFDDEGNLYAAVGTDGCDYVHADTFEVLPHASFYTTDVHRARILGLTSDEPRQAYEAWFNDVVNNLPGVHHYSWIDIGRKIRTYRDYWSSHWQSLYDIVQEDTPENNMFFQKAWDTVTEEEIDQLSAKLGQEMGGWIFHCPVDFDKPTPHISVTVEQPASMKNEK
jgi:glycosyltransferase involved in cell wall biosynthesis